MCRFHRCRGAVETYGWIIGHAGGMASVDELRGRVREFLAGHDPATADRVVFLGDRYDAGLAWVSFPAGLGGLGLPRELQSVVDAEFAAAGAPEVDRGRSGIG